MNASNNDPPEGENITSREEFLTDIKNWQKRLRLGRPIVVIMLLILIFLIYFGLTFFIIGDLENYIGVDDIIGNAFSITVVIYSLWVGFKVPKKLQDLLITNKEFFESEEIFKKFKSFTRDTFRSKKEFYIPLIIAIYIAINLIYSFYIGLIYIFTIYQLKDFLGSSTALAIWIVIVFAWIVRSIIYLILMTIIFLIGASGIVIVTLAFKCLNRLGTEEFPLNVSYKELRMGGFNDLGKFIISMTIPGILLSTLMSAMGLFFILVYKVYILGYIVIFSAITIDLIFIIVLFRSTINIHKTIIKFKSKLKKFLLDEVGKYSTPTSGEIDYQKICNIYDYYDKIDKINDWPFNTTMFKKLVITLISTVVPLILSLFGFA